MFSRRPWPIRFTRFGTYYILFSLAIGAAAINTGNNLLYLMLGLLLGLIIISGFLSDSCLWGTTLDVQSIGDLYVGEPGEMELTVSKSWFPGIILRVQALWSSGETQNLFYWVPRYNARSLRASVRPGRRGWFELKSWKTSTQFPFGLFEKIHQRRSQEKWLVLPHVAMLPMKLLQAAGLNFADAPANRKGLGAIPFDLRAYQTGDSSKRIHWKASARRGLWMVADMEEESAAGEQLNVSRWPVSAESELFISFLASWVFTLYRLGRPFSLHTPDANFPTEHSKAHLKKILTYLALVHPEQNSAQQVARVYARGINAEQLWSQFRRTS